MTKHANRSSHFSTAKSLVAVASLAICTASLDAQVWDCAGSTNNRGYHSNSADRNMARHNTRLYAAVVLQDGRVQIRSKLDDTTSTSPWSVYVNVVNSTSTGFSSIRPTNTVSMAVTNSGHLHVIWGRYYYPSFFRQYYRCYEIGGTFSHAIQDITALVGATSSTRTVSMAIAVDGRDKVFMTAPNGTQNWRSRLLESDWISVPVGSAPAWINRGSIAGNSASSQNVSMAIDSTGLVQMSFYNNVGNGNYATRVFRPDPVTWYAQEFIGVPITTRDDDGYITTGINGLTHVIYKHVVGTSGGVTRYHLLYRCRTGTTAWDAPILVYAFDSTQSGANQPKGSYSLAVGRRVFAVYKEYDCNRLMVKRKNYSQNNFEFLAELRNATGLLNDYYIPNVRSTMWPAGNRLSEFLDVTFRRPTGTTYELDHQRLHVREMWVDMEGCLGSCGRPAVAFSGVPASILPRTIQIGVERANPGSMGILLLTINPSFALPFGCGTLYADSLLLPTVTINSCCYANKVYNLGPGGYGTYFYFQWAIMDSGWKLSNRGRLRL